MEARFVCGHGCQCCFSKGLQLDLHHSLLALLLYSGVFMLYQVPTSYSGSSDELCYRIRAAVSCP